MFLNPDVNLVLKIFVHPGGKAPQKGKPGDAGLDVFANVWPPDTHPDWINDPDCFPASVKVAFASPTTTKIPLGFSYSFWLYNHWSRNCELSHDFFLDVRNRSGVGTKEGLVTVAEIGDANYRGVIHYCVAKVIPGTTEIFQGMKVAQAIINPFVDPDDVEIVVVNSIEELGPSVRGDSGFGASGK